MKSVLVSLSFAILSLLAVACKKTADVDPRDQYFGVYSVTFEVTERNFTNGKVDNRSSNEIVTVSKGSSSSEILISSLAPYSSFLENDRFNIPTDAVKYYANGQTFYLVRNGFGSFSKNAFSYGYVDSGKILGQDVQITTVATGKKK
jgi:hypothetical protein